MPLGLPDWEGNIGFHDGGDGTSIVPDVELVDEEIQGRTKVVKAVANDERGGRVKPFDFSHVKAILQCFTLWFDPNGAHFSINTPVDFVFQNAVMMNRPSQLGEGLLKAAAHSLPLERDAGTERLRADTGNDARGRRAGGHSHPDAGRGLS